MRFSKPLTYASVVNRATKSISVTSPATDKNDTYKQ